MIRFALPYPHWSRENGPAWAVLVKSNKSWMAVARDPRIAKTLSMATDLAYAWVFDTETASEIADMIEDSYAIPVAIAGALLDAQDHLSHLRGEHERLLGVVQDIRLPIEDSFDEAKVTMDAYEAQPHEGVGGGVGWELQDGYVVIAEERYRALLAAEEA